MVEYTSEFLVRFWEKVDCTAGLFECWNWTASAPHGYGQINLNGYPARAHRISYELAFGEFPESLHVLHRCDNPLCCNPGHLFLGTNLDNARDREQKHRGKQPRGESNGRRKLTENQVVEIRTCYAAGGVSKSELARRFRVGYTTIKHVIDGTHWKHVK